MKKYWLMLKNQVSLITNYRVELFGRWIMNAFEIIVYFSLWRLTTQGNPDKTKELFIYFLLTYGILQNLQTGKAAQWMADDILSGDAAKYFIKPISFPLTQIIKSVTVLISRIAFPSLLIISGIIIRPDYFSPVSGINFFFAVLFALLGLVAWNQLMILIGTIAFWGTEINSLLTVVDLILNLIKGAYIPAFLFPATVKKLLRLTPINYFIALPIQIYQQTVNYQQIVSALVIIIGWIGILYLAIKLFYKKALKHYQVFGG